MLISIINELDWNLNKIKEQTYVHTHLCKHIAYYIQMTHTQRLIGIISIVLEGRRIIYACQVNVATKSAKWPRIKETRIFFFFEKKLCVVIWTRDKRHSKGKTTSRWGGRMLTKCNDYRFQCNILYNAVTMMPTIPVISYLRVQFRMCESELLCF